MPKYNVELDGKMGLFYENLAKKVKMTPEQILCHILRDYFDRFRKLQAYDLFDREKTD
ncbi:hypothetical protein LJC32_05430 [Oscillospiraceae bacterium OttesenSCG-928-F05]|nr:hypothetical protein [Oscillospiraceae bacterium OttesenSCG-928-F05]